MRGIATHTQVSKHACIRERQSPLPASSYCSVQSESAAHNVYSLMQAMHAQSSVAVGLKGATKAMASMNKVSKNNRLHLK